MSALPIPAVQSLSPAESTRTLPPAPAAEQDRSRSFAATLERHAERPEKAAAPASRPPQEDGATTSDTAQRPTTNATGPDDTTAQPPAVPTATAQASEDPMAEAQVMADQAALVATMTQLLATTDATANQDPLLATTTVTPNQMLPTTSTATTGVDPSMKQLTEVAPSLTGTTMVATMPVEATAPIVSQIVAPVVNDGPSTITAQTAIPAQATDQPILDVAKQEIPVAQAPAIQAAIAPTTTPVDASTASAVAPTVSSLPAQAAPAAAASAAGKSAGTSTSGTTTAPVTPEDDVPRPMDTDAVAVDVALPIAAVPGLANVAQEQKATGQNTATSTPVTAPTTTTNAMQSTAQQLHLGKAVQAKSNQDERPQPVAIDKPVTEIPASAPNAAPIQPRAAGFEQVPSAMPTGTAANPMDKAVANQVSRTLVQHLPNGDKMMTLRLTPPELGTVRIEMVERQGVLTARLHAEDDGVRLALEKALPLMRQELRASDAPVRDVQVGDQSRFDQAHSQQQGQGEANRNGGGRRGEDDPVFSIDGSAPVRERPRTAARALGGRADGRGVDALA